MEFDCHLLQIADAISEHCGGINSKVSEFWTDDGQPFHNPGREGFRPLTQNLIGAGIVDRVAPVFEPARSEPSGFSFQARTCRVWSTGQYAHSTRWS